ncbi:Bardet-Biedl syndrome 4 protein homolog isoform X1 [Zeugodacus cucurbitae]|uniref:Bardet-Biedl syndrome 4 protein homolog isoform X1 n=1 Tax=Zeugodacus cucurbitae TaxID=28588 RepID=UPI0023D96569|nr:Bardet-Biedl syndrome 4 protein homolog isoform X1 [Zeugodacus cucurbitae]XP_054090630.1 Bardet-Biedl syndrome 4 protein homolog isoform X1 [Zeugodacus cucurbitae]XP_054090631.1 Bardet-Biedl syndrome 4 protein homolog isoform X1 [Zeugodacus cucurbitae]XP_054090633.1 Bardet-Biedl syndrome 4 protein homolog isoform X1 [Zeugodacus cucurbitae]
MASADEIICNGHVITLPTLEVVKAVPIMAAGTNIDWLLHLYYARRDFIRCRIIIERELRSSLNPEYMYFVKGLIDREEGNNIEALRNLQKALDLNSKNIEIYKEIGKTLFIMGRFNQALDIFREAEELSPRQDHEICHFIGELLHRSAAAANQLAIARKEEAEAKFYFEKAVQAGKKLESFQRLAEILRKEKDYAKAIEVLENCLLLSPENTEVLTEIGVLYLKINDTQNAFDRLSEVIALDRKSPKGLLAYGAILQSRNDVDGALEKYQEIAMTEPDIPELWNNIGLCFFKKKQQKVIAAISSLRKSIWLSPLNYNALYNLSLVYITAQQYASAFHTLAAAINLRKDSAECYMLLGICLRKLEDTENAFKAFQRSSDIQQQQQQQQDAGRNPLVHLNFALFCYETGRVALATEQFTRFVSSSQDLLLPTEYKFQATKLKSLLKVSTSNILTSTPTGLACDANAKPSDEIDSQLTGSANNNNNNSSSADNMSNKSIDDIYGIYGVKRQTAGTKQELHNTKAQALATAALAAASTMSAAEMPLEVHAVVNA